MNTLIKSISHILLAIIISSCATYKTTYGHLIADEEIAQIKKNISTKDDILNLFGAPSFTLEYGNIAWYYVFENIEQKSLSTSKKIDRDVLIINFDKTGNKVVNFSKNKESFAGKYTIEKEHTESEFKSNVFHRYINGIGKATTPDKK
jgi:outer membrane protein assembly factor BamE (lipoprotein component of BamABCDE complex)